jgi:cell division protein FtsL
MTMKLGLVSLLVALLAASGLYVLKDRVRHREGELRGLQVAISAEKAKLNRLRAEWALLNQPGRLARLASSYLELQPAQPGQIVRITDIPLRADLELGQRPLTALLPSGVEIPLRLKPPERLALPGPWRPASGQGEPADHRRAAGSQP